MGEDTRVHRSIGDGGHPERIRRPARLQVDPSGEDGDGRVPLEIGRIEATQAALDGREVPPVVERGPGGRDDRRRLVERAGGERMLDREVQVARIAVPRGGRPVKRRRPARLSPLELGKEELAEQVVVAVGERTAADLLDEQVAPDEAFEASAGVGHPGDDFRNTGRHHLHDRGPREEPQVVLPKALGQLGREVGRDVAVAAGDGDRHAALTPGAPAGDRCEIRPDRPALGSPMQLQHAIGVELAPGRPGERGGLLDVERKRRRADLEQLPAGAVAPERHRRLGAAGQRNAEVGGQVVEQGGERVETRPVLEAVRVVEDQQRRFAPAIHLGHEARHRRAEDAVTRCGVAGCDRRIHGSDAPQGGDEVADQDDRVVVQRIERQPRDRARLARGPLRQDGCLAVARRGDQRHDRRTGGCEKGRNDAFPIDGSDAFAGGLELGLEQRPGRRKMLDASGCRSAPAFGPSRDGSLGSIDGTHPASSTGMGTLAETGRRRSRGTIGQERDRVGCPSPMSDRSRIVPPSPCNGPGGRTRSARSSVKVATGPVNPRFRADHGSAAS